MKYMWLLTFYFYSSLLLAQLTPPEQSYVLWFDQTTALAPDVPELELDSSFTMESWIYLRDPGVGGFVMGKETSTGPLYSISVTEGTGQVVFTQGTGEPGIEVRIFSGEIPLLTWTHVAATLDSDSLRLFINGEQVARALNAGVSPVGTSLPFSLSHVENQYMFDVMGFLGALRQVRVWNRALTLSEIRDNAEAYLSGNDTGLVAYWPLDDGAGQHASDHSPNGFHLTLGIIPEIDEFDARWTKTQFLDDGPYFSVVELPWSPPLEDQFLDEGRLIDFDSDGDLDFLGSLATGDRDPSPLVAFRNDGQGNFTEATSSVFDGQEIIAINPRDYAIADFNGDGLMDAFLGDAGTEAIFPYPGGQNRIIMQTTDGYLRDETDARIPELSSDFTHSVSAADIDGDGDTDIFVNNINMNPYLLINDGTGHFTSDLTQFEGEVVAGAITLVDVDKDGDSDLILGGFGGDFVDRDVILLNDGTGNFDHADENSMPPRFGGHTWGNNSITSADFDGDGWADLLMNLTSGVGSIHQVLLWKQLLLNRGDGSFYDASERVPQQILPGGNKWIFPADFNGDGWEDFVTMGGDFRIYINRGEAHFIDATDMIPIVRSPYGRALPGDLNSDGYVDLFMITASPERIRIALNVKQLDVSTIS
ncbi:MAG: FG-GAP-like repeat-containing protein, partial [Candidatus Neomarinimicrobiota bacterium]